MKRVGTITAAAGLIFLGVWMIAIRTNQQLGNSIFSWWPALIILLGVEVIAYGSMKEESRRGRFNYLIIPIIIVFLFISMFQGITRWFTNFDFEGIGSLDQIINWGENISTERYKEIRFSGTLESKPRTLEVLSDNLSVDFRKSDNNEIKVEGSVYFNKSWNGNSYQFKENVSGDITTLNFEDGNIKMAKMTIYLPQGLNLNVNGNNLKLSSENNISFGKINIDSNNGSIYVANSPEVFIKCDNGIIDILNSRIVEIDSNNPSINIEGDTERLKIEADNGKVDVRNSICREIDIKIDNGKVDLITKDRNVSLDIKLDRGYYSVNGERKVNSNLVKQLGTGEGRVKIEVDNGTVNFSNQE